MKYYLLKPMQMQMFYSLLQIFWRQKFQSATCFALKPIELFQKFSAICGIAYLVLEATVDRNLIYWNYGSNCFVALEILF